MKINDYLFYDFKKIFRNKKNISYIVIISFCSLILLVALTFYSNVLNYVKIVTIGDRDFRTLSLPVCDTSIEEISKIDHVQTIYNSKYNVISSYESSFKTDNLDGGINLMYSDNTLQPSIVKGRNILENERNVAICPIEFFPDSKVNEYKIDKNYVISYENLIDKTFFVKFRNKSSNKDITKEFKIIGFYDTKNEIRFNNDCYISKDDIKEISDFVNPLEKDTLYATSVVVDDTKNIEFVKNEIKKLGIVSDDYTIETVAGFDTGLISLIRVSCLVLLNVILVVTFFLAISYMKKRVIDENKNIDVMKFMGFTKKDLNNLFLIQNIIMNLIAYIIGFVAFLIIYIIIKNTLLYAINYSIINISINLFPILLSFVVIMSSSIIVILYIKEIFSRNNYAQL